MEVLLADRVKELIHQEIENNTCHPYQLTIYYLFNGSCALLLDKPMEPQLSIHRINYPNMKENYYNLHYTPLDMPTYSIPIDESQALNMIKDLCPDLFITKKIYDLREFKIYEYDPIFPYQLGSMFIGEYSSKSLYTARYLGLIDSNDTPQIKRNLKINPDYKFAQMNKMFKNSNSEE